MKKISIPKKTRGKFRTIYVPSKSEKRILREFLPGLTEKVLKYCGPYVHGFIPGRSCVTNAVSHIGYNYTTCFDLEDFFDSVQRYHVEEYLTKDEIKHCLIDGSPRQGLPTSPLIANLAAVKLDKLIISLPYPIVYTRYADDLAFSYNDPHIKDILYEKIPELVKEQGFSSHKRRTMSSNKGRRMITGVAVDDKIYPTRAVKRKYRAAIHKKNKDSAGGLSEWMKLKMPHKNTT